MIVYKAVFKCINGKMISSNGCPDYETINHLLEYKEFYRLITLEYSINKITTPILDGSKLFCFDSIHNCVMFFPDLFDKQTYLYILECEATNVVPKNPYEYACKVTVLEDIWKNQESHTTINVVGSLGADSIKPLRLVSYEEIQKVIGETNGDSL